MNKKILLKISIFGLLTLALTTGFSNKKEAPRFEKGEFIVKINSAKHQNTERAGFLFQNLLGRQLKNFSVRSIKPFVTDTRFALVKIEEDERLMEAISTINSSNDFEYAQPNFVYTLQSVPNDTNFAQTWGLLNVGQVVNNLKGKEGVDIGVLPLWEKGIVGKKDIIVAVIDTGIDGTHPDLAPNMYTNSGEAGDLATNGVDDDNNGFIDDVSGWNFYSETNNPMDGHSHGTHCSGTIGAVGNNEQGVAGVNWNVRLMPLKIFSDGGMYSSDAQVIEAINYAVKMGARVLNNSWGGGNFSQAMFESIENANQAGVVFVAAAGNASSNNDVTPFYPAGYKVDNVISVAAITNMDGLASFSCYGAKSVHVAAPGHHIYSTVPGAKYKMMSGTSMATPHVSGIAALLLSEFPEAAPGKIKDILIKSSVSASALTGKVVANGRVNVANAHATLAKENEK